LGITRQDGSPARHRSAVRRLKKRRAIEKMGDSSKVILASASPRRRQLLASAGIEFEAIESLVPERHVAGEPARDYALRMAREKYQSDSCLGVAAAPSTVGIGGN